MNALREFFWPKDLTYGRASLPYSPAEQKVRAPPFACSEFRVPFPFRSEKDYIFCQAWTHMTVSQRSIDMIQVIGINEYGGRFSEICLPILEAGFRIIVIDLPGHGRSTGVHALINDWHEMTEAVRSVLEHVRATNQSEGKNRKIVLSGGSLGGFVTLACTILHPDLFDAFIVQCPLIHVSPTSRPSKFIEYLAKMLTVTPLGRLGLAEAQRGKTSGDPTVYENFITDPQTYHGLLRVRTGLAMLNGLLWIEPLLSEVKKRFLCQHGNHDRVCDIKGSHALIEQCQTPDDQKTFHVYEGVEHDMFRDAGAAPVMRDFIDWLIQTEEYLSK